jgi:hypothetical protein
VFLPSLPELTLFVRDLDKSARFHCALGIKPFAAAEHGRPRMVEGSIARAPGFQLFPSGNKPTTRVQLGFHVADLESRRRAGSPEHHLRAPHGETTSHDRPDGNRVHLAEVAERK